MKSTTPTDAGGAAFQMRWSTRARPTATTLSAAAISLMCVVAEASPNVGAEASAPDTGATHAIVDDRERFAREPSIREVMVRIATPERISADSARRSRRAQWLPEDVRLSALYRTDREDEYRNTVDQRFDEFELLEQTDIDDSRLEQRDSYLEFRVQLTWNLRGVAYSDDEPSWARQDERERAAIRENRERIVEIWQERRELQAAYIEAVADEDRAEALSLATGVEARTLFLDDATGGWFSEQLRNAGVPQGAHLMYLPQHPPEPPASSP